MSVRLRLLARFYEMRASRAQARLNYFQAKAAAAWAAFTSGSRSK